MISSLQLGFLKKWEFSPGLSKTSLSFTSCPWISSNQSSYAWYYSTLFSTSVELDLRNCPSVCPSRFFGSRLSRKSTHLGFLESTGKYLGSFFSFFFYFPPRLIWGWGIRIWCWILIKIIFDPIFSQKYPKWVKNGWNLRMFRLDEFLYGWW